MTRPACFRSLSLGALALTLLLGSCQGAQKATTAEDKHHLQGTEWCDSTGIFTLHFNSPEDVELSLNYEGSPMGTLKYDIPCHFSGDTIYIDDYAKTTPFGKITHPPLLPRYRPWDVHLRRLRHLGCRGRSWLDLPHLHRAAPAGGHLQ